MANNQLAQSAIRELQDEYTATKKCLERIPEKLFDYKPHPKSMTMGYLALLVAEIPLWISVTLEKGMIDLATFPHPEAKTNQVLMEYFENNFDSAIATLERTTDENFEEPFSLKANDQDLYNSSKKDSVFSSINHWVHHRGQLTVYMRLNDIDVPSIYGPSADDKNFATPKR